MGTFSIGVRNALLDAVARNVSYANPAIWAQLHVGDPGPAGTANQAAEAARKQVTFGTPQDGEVRNSLEVKWLDVAASETYSWVSMWSAPTGGTFVAKDDLSAPVPVNAGDTFKLAPGDVRLFLSDLSD